MGSIQRLLPLPLLPLALGLTEPPPVPPPFSALPQCLAMSYDTWELEPVIPGLHEAQGPRTAPSPPLWTGVPWLPTARHPPNSMKSTCSPTPMSARPVPPSFDRTWVPLTPLFSHSQHPTGWAVLRLPRLWSEFYHSRKHSGRHVQGSKVM